MVWLKNKHKDLVIEENFIARIFELRGQISGGWQTAAAQEWHNNKKVISQLAENGILLPTTQAGKAWSAPTMVNINCSDLTTMTARFCSRRAITVTGSQTKTVEFSENKELDAIGLFNSRILTQIAEHRNVPVGTLTTKLYALAKAEKNPQIKQELYQSYIAVEKHFLADGRENVINYAWAHNNLGYSLLKSGDAKTAFSPLKNAFAIGTNSNLRELILKSYRNLRASGGHAANATSIFGESG